MELKEITMENESNKKKTWSHSIETNGFTKSVKVQEVENGFIIRKCIYGSKSESDKYIDEEKTWISNDNPLAEEKKADIKKEAPMSDIMSSIKGSFGMLNL